MTAMEQAIAVARDGLMVMARAWPRPHPRQRRPDAASRRLLCAEESGSSLVEVAVVLPLYCLLIFVLISFAIVLFAYCNATYASKAAVRYAIVHSSTSMLPYTQTYLQQSIVSPLLLGAPTASVNVAPSAAAPVGSSVTVTVTLTYSTGMAYGFLNNFVATTTAQGTILH